MWKDLFYVRLQQINYREALIHEKYKKEKTKLEKKN